MPDLAVRFSAIPLAQYSLPSANPDKKELKDVTVYELEPQDAPVLDRLEKRVKEQTLLPEDNGLNDKDAHYDNLDCTITDAKRILRHRQDKTAPHPDSSAIYLAVADRKPCGLLIGNMPKITRDGRITHTYRDKPLERETELDWLMTWPLGEIRDRLKGVGKVLLGQFYEFCRNLGSQNVYIRAEIPEKSVGVHFYHQMGCKRLQAGTLPWQAPGAPVDLVTHLYDDAYEPDPCPIVPMEVSTGKAIRVNAQYRQAFQYQPLPRRSVPIAEAVDLATV